jgi:hypothetical protein
LAAALKVALVLGAVLEAEPEPEADEVVPEPELVLEEPDEVEDPEEVVEEPEPEVEPEVDPEVDEVEVDPGVVGLAEVEVWVVVARVV